MQSYGLKLAPGQVISLSVNADLFVYESASATRPNMIAAAEALDAASWAKGLAAVTANMVAGPELGVLRGDKFTPTATTGNHTATQTFVKPALPLTYTVQAKFKDAGASAVLQASVGVSTSGGYCKARINTSTGAGVIAYGGNISAGAVLDVVDAGNGWWRVALTVTTGAETDVTYALSAYDVVTSLFNYAANGIDSFYVLDAFMELGANISQYNAIAAAGESRIMVKPDTGAEIVLRPGQRFRLAPGESAGRWQVRALDPLVTIDGNSIIGSGEFDDANTINKFTLDATLVNNVTVTNGIGNRVPVSLDTNQILNTGAVVAYNQKYSSTAALAAGFSTLMLNNALNAAGATFDKFDILAAPGVASYGVVLAKLGSVAPTAINDGDVLLLVNMPNVTAVYSLDIGKTGRIKIPAGYSIWWITSNGDGAQFRNALFTVL